MKIEMKKAEEETMKTTGSSGGKDAQAKAVPASDHVSAEPDISMGTDPSAIIYLVGGLILVVGGWLLSTKMGLLGWAIALTGLIIAFLGLCGVLFGGGVRKYT